MRRRCATGMELGPFTWADLENWERRTRRTLQPFELEIFERIDSEMLRVRKQR